MTKLDELEDYKQTLNDLLLTRDIKEIKNKVFEVLKKYETESLITDAEYDFDFDEDFDEIMQELNFDDEGYNG